MPRLFVIDDRDQTVDLLHRHLPDFDYVTRCGKSLPCQVCEERARGCPLRCAHDYREAAESLGKLSQLPDLVVLDLHFALPEERLLPTDKTSLPTAPAQRKAALEELRRRQGLLILNQLRQDYPRLAVVMLTTTDTELGSQRPDDPLVYLCENEIVDSRSLGVEIRRVLEVCHETQEGHVFWGKSAKMAHIRRSLSVLAQSPLPVLIEGETGTGKSFLAEQVIHPRSGAKGQLVITDLSTLPPALLPAHLFGVRRGAYTGATEDHAGVFEQAHQGTLFLDEIANLDLDLQRQLLLVLERNVVTRLGDQRPRPAMTKLVAATNQDLAELVKQGRFRADLFMRLNPAMRVRLPSLRERPEDIADVVSFAFREALLSDSLQSLVRAFLTRHPTVENFDETASTVVFGRPSAAATPPNAFGVFIGRDVLGRLKQHSWPGNHREVKLFAMNALVFALSQHLEQDPSGQAGSRTRAPAVLAISDSLADTLLGTTRPLPTSHVRSTDGTGGDRMEVEVPHGLGFARTSAAVERQYLHNLFLEHDGDLGAIARRLLGSKGTARQVHLRMNQLGLSIRELRQGGPPPREKAP